MLDSSDAFEDKVRVYFLLLSNAILVDKKQFKNDQHFEQVLSEFKQYLQENSGQAVAIESPSLESAFAKQPSERKKYFARIKQLIPNP